MGGSVWEFKIDPKRLREGIKQPKDDPRTVPWPPSAARSKQTRPKRVPGQTVSKILELFLPKELQGAPARAPKRSPREPPNACKTIFGSKTLIIQKCEDSCMKINIFEGGRVSLGAQN